MEIQEKVSMLAEDFAACSKILTAIGDETRQHLIVEMMKSGKCRSLRRWTRPWAIMARRWP